MDLLLNQNKMPTSILRKRSPDSNYASETQKSQRRVHFTEPEAIIIPGFIWNLWRKQ
ncbi:Hypothetical predicted protein [Pelobates cultripes]|uniref:Uncharacterized protein n=1 Tax=Pelobates cultripes TaxID=61616 RepID=A0AAD1TL37_PELCU|nr:Hypothetical predicted protein [Pelobates cultripes]